MKNKPKRIGIPHNSSRFLQGFTLIELLVVIVIIAVLASFAFVMVGKMKVKAYRANALSSLRQVAAFNVAYATENNGDINTLRWAGDAKNGSPGWVSATYWGRLQPYLFPDAGSSNQNQLNKNINQRMDRLFNTPDANKMTKTILSGVKIYHDTSGLPVPFAFNAYLVPWDKFAKMSSISDPSEILYFTYGSGMFKEASGKVYEPLPTNGEKSKNPIYYLDDQKALGAFLDGHVESLSAPIPDRKFQ